MDGPPPVTSEAFARNLLDNLLEGCQVIGPDYRYLYLNDAAARHGHTTRERLLGRTLMEAYPGIDATPMFSVLRGCMEGRSPRWMENEFSYPDGQRGWFELRFEPVPEGVLVLSVEITERKRAEEALRKSERLLTESQAVARIGSWEADVSTGRAKWSPEMYRICGVSPDTFEQSLEVFLRLLHPDDRPAMLAWIAAAGAGEKPASLDFRVVRPDGQVRVLRGQGALQRDGEGRPARLVGTAQDVTEQKAVEDQLRQAQKMEAVGRLAGGVAHDFNNILSVIQAYADFATEALREGDPLRDDIEEIRKAGTRAAALTRQLLAFSRRQVLEPRVLDLNRLVADLEKMLRRLIGEDIDLQLSLAPDLGRVKADPGQIEQVIMNLVVNARDAMPAGGTLTIETSNVDLDEEFAARHVAVNPGSYVLLAVSDTGCGMEEATKERLFEPFFTTKEKGKGTGLGLSTAYGIVTQSGGHIRVYSELHKGTTFKVYLPRVSEAPVTAARKEERPAAGTETILVVEDEEAVRDLTARILRGAGFTVLAAAHGGEALLLCERHRGEIHLLLTDVVMPQMSGRQLAERLMEVRPGLRVLYMSGYTDDAIVRHGVLEEGTKFIGKPFSATDLKRKVRDALDDPPRP